MNQLSELNLAYNLLKFIPECIFTIPNVVDLILTHNKITQLPSQLKNTKIHYLDLSYNLLTDFPSDSVNTQYLEHLELTGNPIPDNKIEKLRKQLPDVYITFE